MRKGTSTGGRGDQREWREVHPQRPRAQASADNHVDPDTLLAPGPSPRQGPRLTPFAGERVTGAPNSRRRSRALNASGGYAYAPFGR